jgi:CelD/BcsL family acetyltransferase involved in cellulose biosynthesis
MSLAQPEAFVRDPDDENVRFTVVRDPDELASLADEWDALVTAMPRPSPYLLHARIVAWWNAYASGRRLAVHVARRSGRLVGAFPVCLRRQGPLDMLEFLGGRQAVLADVLLADGEDPSLATELARRGAHSGQQAAALFGLPGESRLANAFTSSELRLIPRLEAPVLDLSPGWEAVYHAKTSSRRRQLHRRRRRSLEALGRLDVEVSRTAPELERALEEAFVVYERRWEGKPDVSDFTSEPGKRCERGSIGSLAAAGVPRIVTLRIDGRPVAFSYIFVVARRMYYHKLAYDPAFARYSPGVVNVLETLALASDEGVERVEFLGGAEVFKLELADHLDPLYVGLGLTDGSLLGRGAVATRRRAMELRARAKDSALVRRLYGSAVATAQRLPARARSSNRS